MGWFGRKAPAAEAVRTAFREAPAKQPGEPVRGFPAPQLSADAFITWRAYPAAGRITIEGRRATGPTIKITGIKRIGRGVGCGYIVAIDKEGAEHQLAV